MTRDHVHSNYNSEPQFVSSLHIAYQLPSRQWHFGDLTQALSPHLNYFQLLYLVEPKLPCSLNWPVHVKLSELKITLTESIKIGFSTLKLQKVIFQVNLRPRVDMLTPLEWSLYLINYKDWKWKGLIYSSSSENIYIIAIKFHPRERRQIKVAPFKNKISVFIKLVESLEKFL